MSKSDTATAKNQAQKNISGIAAGGAVNQEQIGGMLDTARSTSAGVLPSIIGGYSDISSTGGYDPAILGNLRSGYQNMATTGGVSPESEAALGSQAASGARSVYDTLRANAARTSTSTGGYGDTSAIQANLARQGANAATASTSELGAKLAGMKQSGTIAGLAGIGTTEQGVAQGRLAGLGGLGNVYSQNLNQETNAMSQLIDNYAKQYGLTSGETQTLQKIAAMPGFGTNLMSGIIGLGGVASGAMTGFGAMKGGG
jgi:hypothetical protein